MLLQRFSSFFTSLRSTRSPFLGFCSQKDPGTILSTHVHNNKQQGSIHLHQSLNWHILRFSCTSSQCSDTAYEMLCSRFLTFNVSFASQCGLIHGSFLSSLFSPYLALEVNEHFFTCSIHLFTYTMKVLSFFLILLAELEYCFQFI